MVKLSKWIKGKSRASVSPLWINGIALSSRVFKWRERSVAKYQHDLQFNLYNRLRRLCLFIYSPAADQHLIPRMMWLCDCASCRCNCCPCRHMLPAPADTIMKPSHLLFLLQRQQSAHNDMVLLFCFVISIRTRAGQGVSLSLLGMHSILILLVDPAAVLSCPDDIWLPGSLENRWSFVCARGIISLGRRRGSPLLFLHQRSFGVKSIPLNRCDLAYYWVTKIALSAVVGWTMTKVD